MKSPNQHMQAMLDDAVASGAERGLQLTAYHNGKLVVDVCAGFLDADKKCAVTPETLFPVFSSGKGIVATIMHQLVQRGQISYDTPIASVWPEFAAEGKGNILIRHGLNHSTGLQHMPPNLGYAEINNWDIMCDRIAKMRPVSAPGAQIVYHAMTYGWILGEVACRVTGKPFAQIIDEQISQPLGIADLFMGIPDDVDDRIARLEEIFEPGKEPSNIDDGKPRDVPAILMPLHTMMNRADARRACIPASNAITNARALARHYAALVPGGVDGVELLAPERVRIATQLQKPTETPVNPPPRMSLGYFVGGEGDFGSRLTTFGHGGYGGSSGFADPQYHLAVGLTKNLYSKRAAHSAILRELRKTLEIPE